MNRTFIRKLGDAELCACLEARDTIFFVGQSHGWQDIERQVQRLGFGELYIVSVARGRQTAGMTRVTVRPMVVVTA